MTFKDIAVKNFMMNMKKYFSYFLCSSFSIMVFFIYSTLLFNNILTKKNDLSMLSLIFDISMTAVALFSVFFINYAHSAFIKSRYKEFGVYLTLGMTSKDIRKIILFENIIVILSSLVMGLVSGLIFSRLFQMVVIKLLDLTGIGYYLSYKSFILTISVFAFIFAGVIASSRFATRKLEISQLLMQSKQSEGSTKNSILPGLLGVFMVLSSLVILYIISHDKKLNSNIIIILGYLSYSFIGVYLTISRFGRTVLGLMHRRDEYYYKNLLTLTEVNYKFSQNKKIIFVLSILSSMIIYFVASPFALLNQAKTISGMSQINNLEFAEIGGINSISSAKLEEILKKAKTPVEGQKTLEFIQLKYPKGNDKYDVLQSKPIISQTSYNQMTPWEKIQVPKGQLVNLITAWEPGFHGMVPSDKVTLVSGANSFDFIVKDSYFSKWITGVSVFPSSSGVVLNDQDYAQIKAKIGLQNIGVVHIINFKDWEKTESVVTELTNTLAETNSKNVTLNKDASKLFKPASRIIVFKGLKQGYSLFLFVSTIMGLLFFIAAGSVLFFKQYTEINNEKAKFHKLYKLGISSKEITRLISRELKLSFFAPLVLGSIMGYSFMYFTTFLVGGGDIIKDFILTATGVVVIYFFFQVVFYLITKKKYVGEILESL